MRTALYSTHKELGAKIVNFAGYEMPVCYSKGMISEHNFVRNQVGIFDVSHMGQIIITGKNLEKFFSIVTPSNFHNTVIGKAKYTVLLNENACPIDDLIIYKLANDKFFLVLNASRKEIDLDWIKKNLSSEYEAKIEILNDRALLAIQGKESPQILAKMLNTSLAELQYMNITDSTYCNEPVHIARTGYTGEDGFEVSISNKLASKFWLEALEYGVEPIGLGARDSLRLEAGYPLYGHELSEEINIANSTMKWVITSPEDFIGKDKIATTPTQKRVGIKLLDKGVLREGMEIFLEGKRIGSLTSGAHIPTLQASIGQAYIPKEVAKNGIEVEIQIRNNFKKAVISKINFLSV